MHDRRVSRYRSPEDIIGVSKVDDDNLALLINFFTDTYEMVWFQSQSLEDVNRNA